MLIGDKGSAKTFAAVLEVIEALPEHTPDDVPLRSMMPGVWPTVGDLRRLVTSIKDEPGKLPR